jgi:hypothetical protein
MSEGTETLGRMSLIALDSVTGRVIRLGGPGALTAQQIKELPYAKPEDRHRYRCLNCGERLILQRKNTDPRFRDRFKHEGNGGECTAPPEIIGETAEHLLAKEVLQAWLWSAHPDSAPRIEPGVFGLGNDRSYRPDVTAWSGRGTVGIEFQRSALEIQEPAARVRAYRDDLGARRLHLWIFSTTRQTRHYVPGPMRRTVRGEFATVRPTRDQIEIVRAGGSVYWAELTRLRQVLYVPVACRSIRYSIEPGELWAPGDHGDPRLDWHACYPELDLDAELWLLVPVPLAECKISNNREFLIAPRAYALAKALTAAEPGREQHRRDAAAAAYGKASEELAGLRAELEQAAAGHGPAAVALAEQDAALEHAAELEQAAADHREQLAQLRQSVQGLQARENDLAARARRGLVARALNGERRSTLNRQRAAVQNQRTELYPQINRAELAARQAEQAARLAHPGAAGRARAEAGAASANRRTRQAAAIERDVREVQTRIGAAESRITAYGRHAEPAAGAI